MKPAVTAINSRVSALAPVLNGPSVTGTVTVASDAASAPIDIMVKNHAGSIYIFAVAMRNTPAKGSFSIAGPGQTAAIEVLDENRSISAIEGKFQDDFKGYGVHLYKINVSGGTINRGTKRMNPSERSSRFIPVLRAGGGFNSANFQKDAPIRIYSTLGKRLKGGCESNNNPLKVRDGVYIVDARPQTPFSF